MLAPIAHRGPDDEGIWCSGSVGLGHRRLSIIDLSAAGHQPMLTPDGQGVLSYNGEVYNFRELSAELVGLGWTFRGQSDAEVLLAALHHWGPAAAVPRLNGMFAFAYYDARDDALWLARDRLGIKQLYIGEQGNTLAFASEVKAIRALGPGWPIDQAAVQRRLLGTGRSTQTMYSGISGLPAGTWRRFSRTGIEEHGYFSPGDALDVDRLLSATRANDMAGAIASFREALTASVRLHLVSDAPLAAMCSGGVDSSLVAALAHDQIPALTGYVADIPAGKGEGAQAEWIGRHLGIPIRRIALGQADYLRLWPRAVWHLDGPAYHPSEPALLAVALACRADGIKVLLTGEGADELFGGYPVHEASHRRWWRRQLLARLRRRKVSDSWRTLPLHSEHNGGNFETGLRRSLALDPRLALAPADHFARLAAIADPAQRAFLAHGMSDLGNHLAWLLHRHDHMGMAASIEMRVPFIENGMIDLGLHMPYRAKRQGRHGKWAEKQVALARLPRPVVLAKKKGFPMPDSLTRGIERLLLDGRLADLLEWPRSTTEAIVTGLGHATSLRFTAVNLEIWLRLTEGGETVEGLGERLVALAR